LKASVVICSVDRPIELLNCIQALAQMHYLPEEVIVVLGPDQSDSLLALKTLASPFPIRIYQNDQRNLSWSRNMGLKVSKCEFIAYIDDDAIPEPNWLKNILLPFSNSKIGLVGGWTRFQSSMKFQHQNQVVTESLRVRPLGDDEKPGIHEYLSPLGANFAIRRSVGIELNGFDNYLEWWGDEADFAIRLNQSDCLVVFEPSAIVHHFQATSEFRKTVVGAVNVRTPWRSRAYLMAKHSKSIKFLGAVLESDFEVAKQSLEWARINNNLESSDLSRLIQDIRDGIREGTRIGIKNRRVIHSGLDKVVQSLEPVHESGIKLTKENYLGLAPVFIYREKPGISAGGITNWITEICRAFGEKGIPSVYICQNNYLEETSVRYCDGYWIFEVGKDFYFNLEFASHVYPGDLQTFGIMTRNLLNVLSDGFAISNILIPSFEGIGNLFIHDRRLVTTLHTSTKESLENHPNLPFDRMTQIRVDMINKLEDEITRTSPRIIANSFQIANKLNLKDSPRVKVIPHGIRISRNNENLTKDSCKKDKPRVAFIGRWEPRKGSTYLPSIISKILDEGIEVTVAGGDPFGERGKALAKLRKIHKEQLQIFGILEKSELQHLYENSDVVIIPSIYESFGLVAIEALAAGCGIVAFSGSGIEESVNTCINAEFSAVGDVDDFSRKAVELSRVIFHDFELRSESQKYAEKYFSLDLVSEIFLSHLKAIRV
jgi:glycosyltransferase involved in cell wall biosynthesis/GT2 family glycosyltransferase